MSVCVVYVCEREERERDRKREVQSFCVCVRNERVCVRSERERGE